MSLLHSQPAIMRLGKAQAPKARSSSKHNLSVLEFNVRDVTRRWKNCSAKFNGVLFSSRIENGLPLLAELLENARPQMSPELRWNAEHQRVECGQTEAATFVGDHRTIQR